MASSTPGWTFNPLPPLPSALFPNIAFYNATTSSSLNLTYQISLSYPFEWGPPSQPTTAITNHTAHTIYVLDGNAYATTASEFLKRRKPVDPFQPDALIVGIGYPLTDSVYDFTLRAIDFGAPIPGEPVPFGADAFLNFIDLHLRPWVQQTVFPGVSFLSKDALFGHSSGGLFVTWALVTRPDMFDTWIAASPSLTLRNGTVISEITKRFGDGISNEGEVEWGSQNGTIRRPAVFVGFGESEDYPLRRKTQTEAQFQARRKLLQSFSPGKWSHELYDRLVGSGKMRDVVLKGYPGQEHAAAGGSTLMDGIAYFLDW
ncbi:Alpha/Beta hydrolase protein [Apodospora peruviana]|uniref:Alpha/Beta hydrolase protein n=1 Tax=Apodospora peruviana TaxID=516989 RepID=A0AAE0HVB4_9PEZI|nr:Alpha/Beta hydrolase protein [Apodospora peruviana]